ncbi:MAG: hypothetical protein ABSB59_26360 [Streptosporangiaceae bacterium]|jgi:hypothetical protein
MNQKAQQATAPARTAFGRFGRRVATVIAECNAAQRRLTVLRTAPDTYLDRQGRAPADYAEFLFRTSGMLLHEPPAARRANGQIVR